MTAQAAVESGLVCCPEPGCGFTCVHPVGVVVNSGGDITDISHAGTLICKGEPAGRGVSISLRFQCEAGHDFAVDFRFHKGKTAFDILPLGVSPIELPTIWRD